MTISNGGTVETNAGVIGEVTGSTGSVTVTGANSRWNNGGSIDVGGTGTAANGLNGNGSLQISSGGLVRTDHLQVFDTGSAQVNNGSSTVSGLTVSGGQAADAIASPLGALTVGNTASGRMVVQSGGTVSNSFGTIAANGSAAGSVLVQGAGSTWTNTDQVVAGFSGVGTLEVRDGGTLNSVRGFAGANANSTGYITVSDPGSTWNASGSFFIGNSGSGYLQVLNGGVASTTGNCHLGITAGATGDVNVSGAGSTLNVGVLLNIGGDSNVARGTGSVRIADGGAVNVGSATNLYSTARLDLVNATTFTGDLNSFGGLIRTIGDTTLANAVHLNAGGVYVDTLSLATNTTFSGNIDGPGGLTKSTVIGITGKGTLILTGANTYLGPTTINAGTLLVDGSITSATTVNTGATLGGIGTVGAVTVKNGGIVSPGHSPGLLTAAALTFDTGAPTLTIELGGTAPGTQYDQVTVVNSASLAGRLDVTTIDGFSPTLPGESFTIVTAGSLVGTFDAVTGQPSATLPGLFWTVEYMATQAILSTTAIPGDIDLDGDVDPTDAALFTPHLGTASGSIWTTGDFDGDSMTTLHDLALQQANFGVTVPSPSVPSAAAVPEPAGWTLAAFGLAILLAFRRFSMFRAATKTAVALAMLGWTAGGAWAQAPSPSGTVITIAGNGVGGFSGDGGPATSASLGGAYGSAIGPDGTLYFADSGNYRIRAIDPATGIITTVAGNGNIGDDNPNDGPATDADLSIVASVAVDRVRNALYIGDFGQNWVSKVDLSTNLLTRYAGTGIFNHAYGFSGDGGPATSAAFAGLEGVATDAAGRLAIADTGNYRIRRVDPVTGIVTTLAGTGDFFTGTNGSTGDGGPATAASFTYPSLVAADSAGNVFVGDSGTNNPNRIRRIDAITGIITTVAGGGATTPGTGPATDMDLGPVFALTVNDAGTLFIGSGYQVFKVDLGTGQLSPFAGAADPGNGGDGGPPLDARFSTIGGLTLAPGGGLIISDVENARIRYVVPDSIHLSGDSGQTTFQLPWVSALSGDLIITNNPNLSVIDMVALTSVAGNLAITGNTSADAINMGALTTVSGDVGITGNTSATAINLGAFTTASGDVDISGNTSAGVINLGAFTTASGDVGISGNTSATAIDMGTLTTVSGNVGISGNTSATAINMSALTTASGNVDISGNTSATAIDMSALTTASGNVDISGNGQAAVVNMAANVTVGGDLTIETTGSGTFDVSGAEVGGNASLTTTGYTEVAVATAGGATAVTMLNSEATMEVTLPDGAFSSANPVSFSVQKLPGGGVEIVGGEMVTQLETYSFEFAIPTLNSAAELNFEIDLVAMEAGQRMVLLDLLHAGAELTLGVLGDAPGAALQLFAVCAPGIDPAVGGCVRALWLDPTGAVLDPSAGVDPSALRFEALVGHFSTYSVVAVSSLLPGDINQDGNVDRTDAALFTPHLGTTSGAVWATGDFDGDAATTLLDLGLLQSHLGQSIGSSPAAAAVPEPAGWTLALLAFAALALNPRRTVR